MPDLESPLEARHGAAPGPLLSPCSPGCFHHDGKQYGRNARGSAIKTDEEVQVRANDRYGAVSQSFHWVTAVLVLVAFICAPGGSETRVYSSTRDFDRQLHETLGLTVFALAILRLLWRTVDNQPDPPAIPRWMDVASKVVQAALYLLMLALPITAIMGAWLEGHPLTLLNNVRLGPLLPEAHAAGAVVASVHGWLGDVIMWVAGVHALAAIFHHAVLRDAVFVSMLPRWFPLRLP
jgi:cytochrome b561